MNIAFKKRRWSLFLRMTHLSFIKWTKSIKFREIVLLQNRYSLGGLSYEKFS